jgi:hypothetical protein
VRPLHLICPLVLFTATLAACLGGSDKGDEDSPLGDEKSDSFFSPTSHGELIFGAPNRAEISDEALFHSWTFTLSGPAQISLRTEIEKNLDTVMYLYRREVGSTGGWGRFLEKNDDHEGELFSQIDLDASAGEYRVLVKGFKHSARGRFAVLGSCTGDGCPQQGACEEDEFGVLPDSGAFTRSCAGALVQLLATAGTSSATSDADSGQLCTLGPEMKRGVDLYRAYWEDVIGWQEFTGGEPVSFEVTHAELGAAAEIEVDLGLDEDAITFLFDSKDDLLMLLQHNQSPDVRWFCARPGEPSIQEPSCLPDMMLSMRHDAAAVLAQGTTTTTCGDSSDDALPLLVGDPVCEFTLGRGIADDAAVAAEFTSWRSRAGLLGAVVHLSAGGQQATYHLGTTFGDHTVIFAVTEAGASRLPCLELR